MQSLFATYYRLIADTSTNFVRYLYQQINWDNRLIVIKGARGVGKTTLLLQHIKSRFDNLQKALYVSADNIWFTTNKIIDLVEYHVSHGGTHLFVDEIHKYPNWETEIKNIYDAYPKLNIVVTGSSILELERSVADLSRRARIYTMYGLSFREYLKLEGVADLPVLSLEDILHRHLLLATEIIQEIPILLHFEKYLKQGYFPFYREHGDGFEERLMQVLETIIMVEIPSIAKIEYDSVYKAKKLLGILASQTPYTLNISALTDALSTSRGNLVKLLELLDKSAVIRRLFSAVDMKALVKPEKVLFNNTAIMYALSPNADIGAMRETFFASQLSVIHSLTMPQQGDFAVDEKYIFEVGGSKKKFRQIKDMDNSYVVNDGISVGFGNKIPLWLFGLLY